MFDILQLLRNVLDIRASVRQFLLFFFHLDVFLSLFHPSMDEKLVKTYLLLHEGEPALAIDSAHQSGSNENN